ncbi:hypothetical protein RSAG8_00023, partial [Rhizoctonia solani AG-8 WAC10335]
MSRLSASEVINRGDYLKPDFEPSTLTIPHLLSVLTYHGIKYPSPHTKGKLIEVFNNELRPRSTELLKERETRERKKPSPDGIYDGHTGHAIQPPESAPLRRSTRRSSRQASESVSESAPVTRRRRSAEPTTTRSSSRNLHQPPTEPILVEESEQEEQAKPEDEPSRKPSRTKGPSLGTRRQSAGLSDANDSAWEDNNIFQSGAEDSSPVKPPLNKRSSMSASPQFEPPSSHSPEPQRGVTPDPIVEPPAFDDVSSSPAFAPRLPTTVSTPVGGLRTFNPPASQIRKSIAPPVFVPPAKDESSSEEEEEEEEEETQKPTNIADQSGGDELVEAAIDVEESDQDSLISDTAEVDQSYEQIEEPADYSSAVAQRIASIGQDFAAGKALVRRADIKVPPVVPQWLSLILGFGFSIILSIIASYKAESSSIGWCDTGSNTNSIIAEHKIAQAARYECAERLYLNSTLGAVGLIESAEGAANRQEVFDGLMGGECTPLPLLPIPHPQTCTPCPEHATCTPPYGMVCDPTYILKPHPLDAILGLRTFASGLPGFGAVAFPPRCVEDDARKRKVSGVAKGMATYLETVKGERVNDLAELVLKEMKRSANRDDYHEIVETALNDLEKYGWVERSTDSNGNQWVASKRMSMGTVCRIRVGARETWSEWQIHFYTLIATIIGAFWTRSKLALKRRESRRIAELAGVALDCVLDTFQARLETSFAFWTRSKLALKRRESRRIAELAGVALDLVRNQEIAHHTDAVRSPHAYVSSLHLRDMVLQDEHNVHKRMQLWSKVAKIVEGNANIRANIEEVAGDETRVWRWVGA